jgi:murein DD-endopeptidase MepM/ murein hydrolase activator NlpD
MFRFAALLCSCRAPQMAALALISIGFAGCSADMTTRFAETQSSPNPSATPSASQSGQFGWQREATGSVAAAVPPAPIVRQDPPQYARSQPQPQPQAQALAPSVAPPQSYPTGGVSGGGRGLASYAPPSRPPLETTGTVAPRSIAATRGPNREAGITIIVGSSDTLETLARRYNVSSAAILQANGYKGPRALSPGQQLIIPRPTAAAAAAPAPALAAPPSRPATAVAAVGAPVAVAGPAVTGAAVAGPAGIHFVNRGDTLMSIAHRNHISVVALARANGLQPSSKLKLGMRITVPGSRSAAASVPAATPAVVAAAPAAAVAPAAKMAAAEPVQKARLAQATTTPEEVVAEQPAKAAEATGALPTFRWPVRGRVITSYGAKTNGKQNDGINVAVPEGTPIKAAEDGVVAYSGNELKGYGNLVLVRHANGYVTEYAHASELMVKRGEPIKRGQVIAKSGQSGEVGSPQLHFEIRKGSTPVDPLQFLNGA